MVEIMSFEQLEKLDPYPTGWKSPNLEFFLSLMFKDNTLTKVLIGTWRQKVRFSVTNNSCEGQITWNDIWHCSNLKHRRHHHKITNKFHDILQTWSDRPIWDQCFPRLFCILVWFSVAAPRAKNCKFSTFSFGIYICIWVWVCICCARFWAVVGARPCGTNLHSWILIVSWRLQTPVCYTRNTASSSGLVLH